MNKKEFLKELEKRLSSLNLVDVKRIIKDYTNYIDDKIKDGLSEKEAIDSFGNIDDIVKELKKTYSRDKNNGDIISSGVQSIVNFVEQFIQVLLSKNGVGLIWMFLELLLLGIIVLIGYIPIDFLIKNGKSLFYILALPLNQIFYEIWKIGLELGYFILVVIGCFKYIKKRYLKENKVSDKKVVINYETVVKMFVIVGKFLSILMLLGLSFYLLGMFLVLGICCYLIFKGVTYFGIYFVMLCLFLLGCLFFSIFFRFVLDKKMRLGVYLKCLVVIFISLGIGAFFGVLEVSNTTFINQISKNIQLEELEEDLPFENDLIFLGNISDYVVDNSLNNIKVVYQYYPIGNHMQSDIRKEDNKVYLNFHYGNIHFTKAFLDKVIDDLKNKELYNYYIEPKIIIKGKEEQLDIIRKNRQMYYNNKDHYLACEFVRTYQVKMIKTSKNGKYQVLLQDDDDMTMVVLDESIASSLEVLENYEFTFKSFQSYIDTDIEDVFLENKVISAKKTDKKGIEQIQDTTCRVFY